jgi:hypothetical protein
MLATIVTANAGTAQFFFLVSAIVAVICVVFGLLPTGRPYAWATSVLVMVVLALISVGLLFLP